MNKQQTFLLFYINDIDNCIIRSDSLEGMIRKIDLLTLAFTGKSFMSRLNDFQSVSSQGLTEEEFSKTVYVSKFNFPIEIYNLLLKEYNLVIEIRKK